MKKLILPIVIFLSLAAGAIAFEHTDRCICGHHLSSAPTMICYPKVHVKCKEWDEIEKEVPYCPETLEGFSCSRASGHKGPHHAHGFDKCIVIWE